MQDMRPDRDPRELSALAGADPATQPPPDPATARRANLRRSRILRGIAIVCVVLAAVAVIVGPHLFDSSRVSDVADRAADQAQGDKPAPKVKCPADPVARNAVKPIGEVDVAAAVICHFPAGAAGTRAVSGPVPAAQLADLSADLSANSVSGPLSGVPGQAPSSSHPEEWVVVAITSTGEHLQLVANSYPTEYQWDGLGPGRVWHPSTKVQQLLASDLPK
jgi:hypothetical protein